MEGDPASPLPCPDADGLVDERDIDEDELGADVGREVELDGTGYLRGIPWPERVAVEGEAAVDDVEIAAAALDERMVEPARIGQVGDERAGVLGKVEAVSPGRTHDLEPSVHPILEAVLALLDACLQAARGGQDPELDEPHRLVGRTVLLRMLVAPVRERHGLRGAGLETAVVAERIGVKERALDDVRQRLDVLVRMYRPFGAGDDAVVVEDPQRADTHLLRIVVAIEAEVPARVEPATGLVPDGVRLADDDGSHAPM